MRAISQTSREGQPRYLWENRVKSGVLVPITEVKPKGYYMVKLPSGEPLEITEADVVRKD